MTASVDYYFSPLSPWTYLGHARFTQIAKAAHASVRLLPIDLGKVFSVSGGLPLGRRAPQRQAYRLVDLQRWADHLGLPMNVEPTWFPVAGDPAARLIVAVDALDGTDAAMALTHALMRAVWAEQRNVSDADTLAAVLAAEGLASRRLDDAQADDVQTRYDAHTQRAIAGGVFGAPSYVIDGEIFWGQDRLDFVQRRLEHAR